eukprot:5462207-Amphidinium_carterae.1
MSRPDFEIPKHRSWNHEMVDQPTGLDEFNHYDNGQKTEFIRGCITNAIPNQAAAKLETLITLHPKVLESSAGMSLPPDNNP